ncbi:hypothetical protein KAR91_53580 [Candidatus Pacearchaeota archaeon]|nr:hypothetical protein [Candidatus Pacearchaeota archaeon]
MKARTCSEVFTGVNTREILLNFEWVESWKHLHEFIRDEIDGVLIGTPRTVRDFFTRTIHELLQGDHVVTAKEQALDINWFTDTMPEWILVEFKKAIDSNKVDLLFSCDEIENTGGGNKKVTWESLTE